MKISSNNNRRNKSTSDLEIVYEHTVNSVIFLHLEKLKICLYILSVYNKPFEKN
jgi:hypothetical protein